MSVNSLEQTECDPDVDGKDMEVAGEIAPQNRTSNGARAKNHDLSRVGVLGSEPERCGVLMVDFMDMLVEERHMESLVGEVVEHVLEDEKGRNLGNHGLPRGEGDLPGVHAEGLSHGVEEEDLKNL